MAARIIGLVGLLASLALLPRSYFRAAGAYQVKRVRRDRDMTFFEDCRRGVLNPMMRVLPSAPRCALCFAPFGGFGPFIGMVPSRKNPKMCVMCFERAPIGGHEMDIGVLFADIRGYTTISESMSDHDVGELLAGFYRAATDVLVDRFAIIDKLVGDEVMALFLPQFPKLGDDTCRVMLEAAQELIRAVDQLPGASVPLGVGLHFGHAEVGNVGSGIVKDFTAVGDTVNVAARLQGEAAAGSVIFSEEVNKRLPTPPAAAVPRVLKVKGKSDPIQGWCLAPDAVKEST